MPVLQKSNTRFLQLLVRLALVTAVTLVLAVPATSNANAYVIWHRTWTGIALAKTPVLLRSNVPVSWDPTISTANKRWNLLPGSNLKTGNVVVTSYLSTYNFAPFRFGRTSFSGQPYWDAPGITFSDPNVMDDVEVLINTDWTYSGYFNLASNVADLATVATHELGHAEGLNHPCNPLCTTAEKASLMNANYTVKVVPTSDDIAGIASLY